MGRSKELYFSAFLDFLNISGKDSITMSLSEVKNKLGKDKDGKWVLCQIAEDRTFWGYNSQHRFPYYLGNNGWKCSTHFSEGKKEITFFKVTYDNKKEETIPVCSLYGINVSEFIKFGNLFEDSFKNTNDKNSPNYHVVPGHEREKSWDYCYEAFSSINKTEPDIDYLCLHLAFYLASWGMYRGSTFLFRNDYKVHEVVVNEIIKHKNLRGTIPSEENIDEIMELVEFIKTSYGDNNHPTKTLITKILLGTLGCVPAYDTYVVRSMKKYGASGELNKSSLLSLGAFYLKNEKEIEDGKRNRKYPPMKFLDMAFFRESYDGENDDEVADEE